MTHSFDYSPWRLSVAPMMDWTDRHCRYLLRLVSPHARLYTEMVTTGALIHGPREKLLAHSIEEYPLAMQLGGNDPKELALCATMAEQAGYQEINLNVGCPSDRVQSGAFGACLMKDPRLVADAVHAMQQAVSIPVTVKHRLGVDDLDSAEFVSGFIDTVQQAECRVFIIHARKAWLSGLSPKENREIPPLRHAEVVALKKQFPHLTIVTNGGLQTADDCTHWIDQGIDGVMIGRAAYFTPMVLNEMDQALFPATAEHVAAKTTHDIVHEWLAYIERCFSEDTPIKHVTRHGLNLFQNRPGAKRWRRHLSEHMHKPDATPHLLREALSLVPE